jgi:hypothetical protein
MKREASEILAATTGALAVIMGVALIHSLASIAPILPSIVVGLLVLASAAALVPVDPAEGLRAVVEHALHLELKSWVVNTEAVRGPDAGLEDPGTVLTGVDLQVCGAEELPRSDRPDVKIVNSRHVPDCE